MGGAGARVAGLPVPVPVSALLSLWPSSLPSLSQLSLPLLLSSSLPCLRSAETGGLDPPSHTTHEKRTPSHFHATQTTGHRSCVDHTVTVHESQKDGLHRTRPSVSQSGRESHARLSCGRPWVGVVQFTFGLPFTITHKSIPFRTSLLAAPASLIRYTAVG